MGVEKEEKKRPGNGLEKRVFNNCAWYIFFSVFRLWGGKEKKKRKEKKRSTAWVDLCLIAPDTYTYTTSPAVPFVIAIVMSDIEVEVQTLEKRYILGALFQFVCASVFLELIPHTRCTCT